ncbi:hypothetical protein [Eubacterium xylanophilum]|uniref:hypothetical protein n=1 Tax=Eubacterium xylanophilum TaxID=39497 RepID=UPI00047C1198|nr:hypothetical protein [Eubacterium xylanophilum]
MKRVIIISVILIFMVAGSFVLFQKNHNPDKQVASGLTGYVGEKEKKSEKKASKPWIETQSVEGEYDGDCSDRIDVSRWDKKGSLDVLKVKFEGEPGGFYDPKGSVRQFKSLMSVQDVIKANKNNYVGSIKLPEGGEGALFFKDNNYYILEYNDRDVVFGETSYSIFNLNALVNLENQRFVVFQMPTRWEFYDKIVELFKENKRDALEYIYKYSFEELVEFYKRIDRKYCSIDEENQIIRIAGRNLSTHKIIKDFATIDYKNHRVITKESRGRKAYWESDKVYIK